MSRQIQDRIREFILQNFYVAAEVGLDDGASLLERGIVDSTGVLEVIEFLEQEFGIRIEDREVVPKNLDSIAAIAAFVARKRGVGGDGGPTSG